MIINFIMSFLSCGIICLIAQLIIDNTKLTPGHITSIFVCIGVLLEFFGLYDYLREIGKVGVSIPISNFGSLMMEGVKQNIKEQGIFGIFTGIFANTGGAITFCVFLSIIFAFFCKPRT